MLTVTRSPVVIYINVTNLKEKKRGGGRTLVASEIIGYAVGGESSIPQKETPPPLALPVGARRE